MQDFPSNSQKVKAADAPREKLKPVTSATKTEPKRGLARQFKETFFSGSAKDAAGYMVEDVVVPAIRDMFHDALHSGLDRLFYGDRSNGRPRPGRGAGLMTTPPGTVNYGGASRPTVAASQQRALSRQARARHDFGDIVIPTRQEATDVIDQMFEQLSRFGVVHVADLYDLTNIRAEHTDMKWGWTSLRGAKPVRLRSGGFLLDLPEPEALS